MAQQLQVTVDQLSKVLNRKMTLVEFDNLEGRPLLKLLHEVFQSLDPDWKVDPDDIGPALHQLTTILQYKPPPGLTHEQFSMQFQAGDKATLQPVLYQVLSRMAHNKKRVYLAKYLTCPPVPEDMRAMDDGVRQAFTNYRALQEQFQTVHKNLETLKKTLDDPAEVKADLVKQDRDKDLLANRLKDAQEKLENGVADHAKYLKAAKELRAEQETQEKHKESREDQQAVLINAQKLVDSTQTRLRETKADKAAGWDVKKMLGRVKDEITANRSLLDQALPKELAEAEVTIGELKKVLNEPSDVDALQKDAVRVEKEIAELEAKSATKRGAQEESVLKACRQQLSLVQKKKEVAQEALQQMQVEKDKLEDQKRVKEAEFAKEQGGGQILTGKAFEQYAQQMREKGKKYKVLLTLSSEMKAEHGVLQHTEELLRDRNKDISEKLHQLEVDRGVVGAVDLAEKDAKLAADMRDMGEKKELTMEKLSQLVKELVDEIRVHRNKLAPEILDLRATRSNYQQKEQEYKESKEVYDQAQQSEQDKLSKITKEVDSLESDCHSTEQVFHRMQCQIAIAKVMQKRVQEESDFRSSNRKLSEKYKDYSQLLDTTLSHLETLSKDLQRKKIEIESSQEFSLNQMQWFKNLRRLLECKAALYKKGVKTEAPGVIPSDIIEQASKQIAGVDRFVLDQP